MQLTDFQKDALQEAMNIGNGQAAAAIASIIDQEVRITIPEVNSTCITSLRSYLERNMPSWEYCVFEESKGDLNTEIVLVFSDVEGKNWSRLVLEKQFGEDVDVDSMFEDTLGEIGNIIISNCIGAVCNFIKAHVDFSVPYLVKRHSGDGNLDRNRLDELGLLFTLTLTTQFSAANAENININILMIMKPEALNSFMELINAVIE